jgi:aminopeptidase N
VEVEAVRKHVSFFEMDAVDLDVTAVRWMGQVVSYQVRESSIHVELPMILQRGDRGWVEVDYQVVAPRAGIYFILPDPSYPHKVPQAWTQGQDDDSRYWFPCFDEPGAKLLTEMTVEAPKGFICTSNGALLSEDRQGDWWKFHWKAELPIPPYLVTLTAVPFSEVKDQWRGRPVHYLVEKGREAEAQVSFGRTPEMMELFSRKTGVDYPYEKYSQIAVAEFVMGGMENTSATTQTDLTLHTEDLEEDFSSDDLVSHELAHQWFGDLVTCHTWAHGWLNESWATFMESVWKEHIKGADETQYYQYEDLQAYLREDSSVYRRPLVTNLYSDPAEIWDRHLYQKGGLLLNMLRAEVGEEDFWRGTQIFLQRHRGKTAETIDFHRAMEEACGRPLDWFFDQWFYHGGHPQIHASYSWDAGNKVAYFRLEQKQKEDRFTPVHKIKSKVQFFIGDQLHKEVTIQMQGRVKNVAIPMDLAPSAVRFDPENQILKTLDWDLAEEMIDKQLSLAGDVVGKIWAMKTLAKKGSRRAVSILEKRLNEDPFWGVRVEAAARLAEIHSDSAFDVLEAALRKEKTSKVRAALVQAISAWKNPKVFALLKKIAEPGESLNVRCQGILALGRSDQKGAYETIASFVHESSWRDLIRIHVFRSLAALKDDRAVAFIQEHIGYGTPLWARPAGILALGSLAKEDERVRDYIVEHLNDKFHAVRFSAVHALEQRGDLQAIEPLDRLAHQTIDGHLKFAAHRAATALRAGKGKSKDIEFGKRKFCSS